MERASEHMDSSGVRPLLTHAEETTPQAPGLVQGELTGEDVAYIRRFMREQSAMHLHDDKTYLIRSRLEPVAREFGIASLAVMVRKLRNSSDDQLKKKVVEAMVTNETSFFRDWNPFVALRESILPEVMARKSSARKLSIWCGACSSGQEPYSVMLTILEHFPELTAWDLTFIATDISAAMIHKCRKGEYSQLEVNRGLPARHLTKYFSKRGVHWQIHDAVRHAIDFRVHNLLDPWPLFPPLDVVLLRNVMIYFDHETRTRVLDLISRHLDPQGYLILGGSETTINVDDRYERIPVSDTAYYRLRQR